MSSSISSFNRWLVRLVLPAIVLVLGSCLAFEGAFWAVLMPAIQETETGKLQRLQVARPNELPIFGSSRGRCSYVPSILGHGTYNYSRNGTGPDLNLALMDLAIRKGAKTIVFNWDFWMFWGFGDPVHLYPLLPDEKLQYELDGRDVGYASYMNFWPTRLFGNHDSYIKAWLTRNNPAYDRGYLPKEGDAYNPAAFAKMIEMRLEANRKGIHYDSDPTYYERTAKYLGSKPNVQFIVVRLPQHWSNERDVPQKDLDSIQSKWVKLSLLPNVKAFNFSQLPMPDDHFSDTYHMNDQGARAFSRVFKDSLDRFLAK